MITKTNPKADSPSPLPNIRDVKSFSKEDQKCLDAIREVLIKYNALERFGLHLQHSHFNIEADEVLVEETDEINRIQTIKPVKKHLLPTDVTYTNWRFDTHSATPPICRIKNQYH